MHQTTIIGERTFGVHFCRLGADPLLRPKVIFILSKIPGMTYKDKLFALPPMKRHEVRHMLDYIYQDRTDFPDLHERLRDKSLLELAGYINSNSYQSELIVSSVLHHFSDQEALQLPSGWEREIQQLTEFFLAIRRKAGSIISQNNLFVREQFLAAIASSSSTIEDVRNQLQEVSQLIDSIGT